MNSLSITKFRATVAACVLALATAAPALHAQAGQRGAKVNVPFAFEVGKTQLPAGQYVITRINADMLLVRGDSAHALVMVNHEEASGPTQRGKIVFVRYGEKYFMHELWSPGSTVYESCVESKDEGRVRTALATVNHKRADGVEVAVSVMPNF